MGKDFFDTFETKTVIPPECVAKLDEALRQEISQGSSTEAAHAKYKDLLQQLLASQGADLQAAQRDNPGFIYLEAATNMQQFKALLNQTAAAARFASRAAAAAAAAKAQGRQLKGIWEPPADDDKAESAKDYE